MWSNSALTGSVGNVSTQSMIDAVRAARDNAPKFGEIAVEGVKQRALNESTKQEAEAYVDVAGIEAELAIRKAEIQRDTAEEVTGAKKGVRKAGKIAAAGALIGDTLEERRSDNKKRELLEKMWERNEVLNQEWLQTLKNREVEPNTNLESAKAKLAALTSNKDGTSNTFQGSTSFSSNSTQPDFKAIADMASKAGAEYPELVAAQWALESGRGTSELATKHNNLFGQKGEGVNYETQEDGPQGLHTINDDFMSFSNPQESVDYLVNRWYKDYGNYTGVNNAKTIEDAAHMLKKEGYATDRNYANKLLDIINGTI